MLYKLPDLYRRILVGTIGLALGCLFGFFLSILVVKIIFFFDGVLFNKWLFIHTHNHPIRGMFIATFMLGMFLTVYMWIKDKKDNDHGLPVLLYYTGIILFIFLAWFLSIFPYLLISWSLLIIDEWVLGSSIHGIMNHDPLGPFFQSGLLVGIFTMLVSLREWWDE